MVTHPPRPTMVRGNDWRKVAVPPVEEFEPTLPVTVVIPYYEAPEALALTLAALEGQTYPRDLFEVIVVDDGSRIPLSSPEGTDLDVKVIRQERQGFGASRARNRGARAASSDVLVFLDCDMMPEAGWLAAHARWHHVLSDALTLGFRAHVEVEGMEPAEVRARPGSLAELFSDRSAERPEWIEFHLARTNELTSTADDIFRVVTSGNLAVARSFFELVGGFDESFTQWGAEDTEFGYRAYTRGALLVPERRAFCWHQGAGATPSEQESRSLDLQQAKIAHLIAHYRFRRASPGRSFTVPQVVVSVETGDAPVDQVFAVVERILGDRFHDLMVRIEDRPGDDGFELVRRHFAPDPRVRFGSPETALDEFPTSSFHMRVPPGADLAPDVVYVMRAQMGGAVQATMTLADPARSRVSITRTWALHRQRRNGSQLSELGERVSTKVGTILSANTRRRWRGVSRTVVRAVRSWRRRGYWKVRRILGSVRSWRRRGYWKVRRIRSRVIRLVKAMLQIRNPRQAWQFVKWLAGTLRARFRMWLPFGWRPDTVPIANYPLGAEMVALGESAVAVLSGSARVRPALDDRHTDLVLADRASSVEPGLEPDMPVVLLSEQPVRLSVPAFDPRSVNPIGWRRNVDGGVGALGPVEMLPAGCTADRTVARQDRDSLLRLHSLVDVAGFHPDPISRAGTLAALAATGVVVRLADSDPQLEAGLGSDLYNLMLDDRIPGDPAERELASVAMRRVAHRTHSLAARARDIITAAGLVDPPNLPDVTVLAVATRPDLLPGLLAAVSGQTYPRLETVLVVHGDGFEPDVEEEMVGRACPATVIRVDDRETLGAALDRATAASRGALITRMDDRNIYGPEHVWDLVIAHDYSQAGLVVKDGEFHYLPHHDRTVRHGASRGEDYVVADHLLAGPALLVPRHELAAAGGWRRLEKGIGKALAEDIGALGGAVYRTHGIGFVRVLDGSTEQNRNEGATLLDQAGEEWDGWCPERIGLDPDIRPVCTGVVRSSEEIVARRRVIDRGPRPTTVRGNDWHRVDVPSLDEFVPALPVTVVVPYFEAPDALELTLAALECQTYPRDMFEVVVVDDGSRIPLRQPTYTDLDVKVVQQEDLGFGLARARNTGARAASHGILVFLDCDMTPEAGWLSAHARWHHTVSDALTLGFRAHVEVDGIDPDMVRNRTGSLEDLFSDRPSDRPEWIEFHMDRTDDLTSTADDLFRVVTGGNLGVSRDFFETVGGFDESFTQWGAEDTEFGYRAFTRGALLVPAREAFCWHQGVGAVPSETEKRSLEMQRAKIAHLIAHYGFRGSPAGRSFTVPQYAVTVQAGYMPAETIFDVVERILADRVHDLVVMIEDRADDEGYEWLRRQLEPDSRVRFGPVHNVLDEFPVSSFHVTVPPGAEIGKNMVYTLRNKLGSAVSGSLRLADGSQVSMVRTWALHRARRAGRIVSDWGAKVTSEFTVPVSDPPPVILSPTARRLRRICSKAGRLIEEFRRVRNLGQAWMFAKWLAGAVAWRLRGSYRYRRALSTRDLWGDADDADLSGDLPGSLPAPPPSTVDAPPRDWFFYGGPTAWYPLGAEMITLGGRAGGVFGSSLRVRHSLGEKRGDLIVADGPDVIEESAVPVVYLSEAPARFSVTAFDPVRINPIGWPRTPDRGVGALGPVGSLPAGSRDVRTVRHRDRDSLRSFHHLEDVAAYHPDATARAATLAALAGWGVVVRLVDHDPALEARLGSELYGLMSASGIREADLDEREALSIRMRRVALREHTLRARARQIIAAGLPDPPTLAEVSVLAATKRPRMVPNLLATVAVQTYPRLELVLVLHGHGFDTGIEAKAAELGMAVRVLRVDGSYSFGTALNRAVSVAGGTLLTKIDDDDHYSAEHVWDLVLAHEYSGAELVAKGSEFVYLARSDRTIHRFCGKGEAASRVISVAGGTMLISRHDLEAAGGWRRVPRGVDVGLIEDVRRVGGQVYRTHGFGYVLVRHGGGHTWEKDDDYFLRQAEGSRSGWAPEFAGLDPDTPLHGPVLPGHRKSSLPER